MRVFAAWRRRTKRDEELAKELCFHLDEHVQDLIAAGVPPDEARRQARLALGGVDQITERVRDGRPRAWLDHLLHDLRDARRSLRRTPGVTAAVVALITLVIAGNTTVFSMLHAVLTKPAPGVQARNLVTIDLMLKDRPYNGGNSYPNYLDYAAQSTTVRPLLVDAFQHFTFTTEDGSYAVNGSAVSTNYFETLEVRPALGRGFTADDDRGGAAGLVAVVSDRLWQRRLHGAPDVIGRAVTVNGHAAMIIGVAPPDFSGGFIGEDSVWIPLLAYARVRSSERELNDRSNRAMGIYGQLAPGASLAQARTEFAAISRRLQGAYPESDRDLVGVPIAYSVIPPGSLLHREGPHFLAVFSVVTLLTVAIVCANVANLMLARSAARQRELALRQSLGASRGRIVRMLVAEGVLVSLVACGVAWLSALAVCKILVHLLPPDPSSGATFNVDFTPDWRVTVYAMALAMLGTVAFTLAPAVRAWRQDVLPWLKAGEHGVVQGRSKLSATLVVLQLAFSVLLLISAGLGYRSLSLVNSLSLGFNPDHLLLVSVNTSGSAATPETNRVLLDKLRDRAHAVPGVASVSFTRWPSGWGGEPVRLRATDQPVRVERNDVGPDYLKVLGLAPLAGREFEPRDGSRTTSGAVVNQHLATLLWPAQSAIGQTLLAGSDAQPVEVIGVAPDAFFTGFRREPHPNFIFELEHGAPGPVTFYIRYAGDLGAAVSSIGRAFREVDANVPLVAVRTMERELDAARWPVLTIITLLTTFAAGSLSIAVIGQYAVVAFGMRRRTRDLGVRMALGASSRDILGDVVGEGMRMTAVGLAIGFALSLAAGAALKSVLYGISPTDARTYAGVFGLLAAASLLACYLPARRATRIDPIQALRQE